MVKVKDIITNLKKLLVKAVMISSLEHFVQFSHHQTLKQGTLL